MTMRAKAGRPEEEYEGEEWEGGYGRGEYARTRGRRESPSHSRSRRHRCPPVFCQPIIVPAFMPCVVAALPVGK